MAASRLVVLLFLSFTVAGATDCVDLLDVCASLQSICIGSILQHHFDAISDLSDQMNDSTIPALESSLPLIQSDLPLVLGTNGDDGSSTPVVEGSGSSSQPSVINEENLKNALPLLKESLPLIRESLPLIRESLPLIRQYLDPIVGNNCQRKATCRTCKDCPKLRDSIISFVEALCPSTCKTCTSETNLLASSSTLSSFFT